MNSYFSTFITGFDEVVADELVKRLKDVEIKLLTDGLIIYETTSSMEEIKKAKFLNNSFVLLKKLDDISENSTKEMCKILLRDQSIEKIIKQTFSRQNFKFRIRASIKNQFVTIDKNLLRNLEEKITRISHTLHVDRSLPDIEFLITIRSEGFGLLGIQFTHRSNYEKTLEKGELYPELAYILCLISDPNKDDVFIDPLSGSGSISIQRALSFLYKKVIAGDNDARLIDKLQKKIAKLNKNITVEKLDATNLQRFESGSIDKLITDPPWGLHTGKELNLSHFYSSLLKEFIRVVKKDGIIVILTAQKKLLESQLEKISNQVELVRKYTTLVSGKKAGVYKLRKIN